jgi:hypothetical protein
MLPVKKLYIDSRHKTADSVSDSEFKIDLPYVIQMPPNTVFFITDVCIPHVWKTVEEDYNDKLYLQVMTDGRGFVNVVAQLAAGNYTNQTFVAALQVALNNAVGDTFVVSGPAANTDDNWIQIATNGANKIFRILTDVEVPSVRSWSNTTVNPGNIASANDLLNNTVIPALNYNQSLPFKCNFLNLHPINNVYITGPNLGSFDTLAAFSNNIIKKVPVLSNYWFMIIDQFMTTNDFLDCSRQTIKTRVSPSGRSWSVYQHARLPLHFLNCLQ